MVDTCSRIGHVVRVAAGTGGVASLPRVALDVIGLSALVATFAPVTASTLRAWVAAVAVAVLGPLMVPIRATDGSRGRALRAFGPIPAFGPPHVG